MRNAKCKVRDRTLHCALCTAPLLLCAQVPDPALRRIDADGRSLRRLSRRSIIATQATTVTAEIGLSGKAGSQRLRGTLHAGFAPPDSAAAGSRGAVWRAVLPARRHRRPRDAAAAARRSRAARRAGLARFSRRLPASTSRRPTCAPGLPAVRRRPARPATCEATALTGPPPTRRAAHALDSSSAGVAARAPAAGASSPSTPGR